jgi:hypothetical protein
MTIVKNISAVAEEGLRATLQISFIHILLDTVKYRLNYCLDSS